MCAYISDSMCGALELRPSIVNLVNDSKYNEKFLSSIHYCLQESVIRLQLLFDICRSCEELAPYFKEYMQSRDCR